MDVFGGVLQLTLFLLREYINKWLCVSIKPGISVAPPAFNMSVSDVTFTSLRGGSFSAHIPVICPFVTATDPALLLYLSNVKILAFVIKRSVFITQILLSMIYELIFVFSPILEESLIFFIAE